MAGARVAPEKQATAAGLLRPYQIAGTKRSANHESGHRHT